MPEAVKTSEPTPLHHHTAFGLKIGSCLPLPELLPADDAAAGSAGGDDIEIVYGEVPAELPGSTAKGLRYQVAPGKLLLQVDGIGRFMAEDGRRVTIQRESPEDDDLRLYLLGSVFGALFHQRQELVLHGSAVVVDGTSVAFLGMSGVGKSTLAMALQKRGYPILTDDLCVIRANPAGIASIQPGFPQSKLWLDSLARLEIPPDNLKRIRTKLQKRAFPLGEGFGRTAMPVRKLYVLRSWHKDELKITPVEGPQKLTVLKNQTYRFGFLTGLGGKAAHFQQALNLAQRVPLAITTRPTEPFKLTELADLLEADFQK